MIKKILEWDDKLQTIKQTNKLNHAQDKRGTFLKKYTNFTLVTKTITSPVEGGGS